MASRAGHQKSSWDTSSPPGISVDRYGVSSGWGILPSKEQYCACVRSDPTAATGRTHGPLARSHPPVKTFQRVPCSAPGGPTLGWKTWFSFPRWSTIPKMHMGPAKPSRSAKMRKVLLRTRRLPKAWQSARQMARALCGLWVSFRCPERPMARSERLGAHSQQGPASQETSGSCCLGKPSGHVCCRQRNSKKESWNHQVHRWVGPSIPTWSRWGN